MYWAHCVSNLRLQFPLSDPPPAVTGVSSQSIPTQLISGWDYSPQDHFQRRWLWTGGLLLEICLIHLKPFFDAVFWPPARCGRASTRNIAHTCGPVPLPASRARHATHCSVLQDSLKWFQLDHQWLLSLWFVQQAKVQIEQRKCRLRHKRLPIFEERQLRSVPAPRHTPPHKQLRRTSTGVPPASFLGEEIRELQLRFGHC